MTRWFRFWRKPKPKIPTITDPHRVNRIVRSKWNNGDYQLVNEYLQHYLFEIDGEPVVIGILEILGAIDALKEAGK